ncbi:hypothetical protein COCSADRAFT_79559, partial [Bipolaris sorokiniana ND90Pr]
ARLLWVDVLYIDQTCTEDKSVQAPRMWAVFTFCQKALIFLGDESDATTTVGPRMDYSGICCCNECPVPMWCLHFTRR